MSNYTGSIPDTKRKAHWTDNAACAGAKNDRWFPHPTNATQVQAVKAVCFTCPVMLECAQHALTAREQGGVWGGLSEGQRTTIWKKLTGPKLEDPDTVRAAVEFALRQEYDASRTLRDVWNERTYPLAGGHIGWRGHGSIHFRGQVFTGKQVAFQLDRGRAPIGIVRRTCPVVECVHPQHVADNEERAKLAAEALVQAAAAAEPPEPGLAPCGTPSAYRRHVRNKEPIDAACRAANTAARYRTAEASEVAA